MMDREKKYLSDILESIELIESFIVDCPDFNMYSRDIKTQSAVERQLGIIGEAVNQFQKICSDSSLLIENAHQIVGLRNRIIHAYDAIDNTIVWAILKRYLPPLKHEIYKKLTLK